MAFFVLQEKVTAKVLLSFQPVKTKAY